MSLFSCHEVAIEVAHKKKRTNVGFQGTLPILDRKEVPHDIVLHGPCGIVSEDSSEYLFTVGSFGTKINEDALEQYIEVQKAIARREDIPTSDLFFLLDSVRRRNRHNDENTAVDPADALHDSQNPDLAPDDSESPPTPTEERDSSSAPSSEDGSDSDPADLPSSPEDRSDTASAADPEPVRRRLVLQPEETLFLSHALGCVRVVDTEGAELAGERLYRHLSDCGDRHLAARYAAYLDLRGRGWVVRDGLLSGADFVLYRRGPAFYHASLVVTVQVVSAETRQLLPEFNWRRADWLDTATLCRTAEQAAKDVLLVRLLWPADLGRPADLSFLSRVAVEHVLLRRWTPSRLR